MPWRYVEEVKRWSAYTWNNRYRQMRCAWLPDSILNYLVLDPYGASPFVNVYICICVCTSRAKQGWGASCSYSRWITPGIRHNQCNIAEIGSLDGISRSPSKESYLSWCYLCRLHQVYFYDASRETM